MSKQIGAREISEYAHKYSMPLGKDTPLSMEWCFEMADKAYQQGKSDALKTIDEYKNLTNSDKVFIVNDEWVKSITEQIRADAIAEFKDLGKLYSEIRTDVIDEVIDLYNEMRGSLATNVYEFGERLKQLKEQKDE